MQAFSIFVCIFTTYERTVNKKMNSSWKGIQISYLYWQSVVREEKGCAFLNYFKISRSLLDINMFLEFQTTIPACKLVCSGSTFPNIK